ncbi:MAG: hypothetical protein DHS20C21_12250 [Gemmatimonadota bacterium]|nr:MAG: hypothetical protein DHS20C21_12250 [Gemmatimonadota bacterium]
MDDSWSRFWDRLIVDWVVVVVGAFVLQGVWFALVAVLTDYQPDLQGTLSTTTGRLALPWGLVTLVGMTWGVIRAFEAKGGQRATR